MVKKTTTKKKYVPSSKEKYMCAKHKKFFTEELLNWNPNQTESSLDYSDYDVIILSDYDKGALIRPWFFKPKKTNVILDPKNKRHEHLFMHSNIITPNLNELKKLSGMGNLN